MRIVKINKEAEEEFSQLKRKYNEYAARERILSLAVASNFENINILSSAVFQEYLNKYEIYDLARNKFYYNWIQPLEEPTDKEWKIDFFKKEIIFYGN